MYKDKRTVKVRFDLNSNKTNSSRNSIDSIKESLITIAAPFASNQTIANKNFDNLISIDKNINNMENTNNFIDRRNFNEDSAINNHFPIRAILKNNHNDSIMSSYKDNRKF